MASNDRRRPCGCSGSRPDPRHRPGPDHHRPGPGYDRPCPCPCGWIPRPEDCDRLYEECRWCGLSREECERRRAACERQWEDWPFYRGPCPKGAVCNNFCSCTPVSAVHGLFTRTEAVNQQANEPITFTGDYLETDCLKRAWGGVRTVTAGTFLVLVTMNLPTVPAARFYVTADGEEAGSGDLTLTASGAPASVSFQAIVTAGAGSVIGLAAGTALNLSGSNLRISMTIVRIV